MKLLSKKIMIGVFLAATTFGQSTVAMSLDQQPSTKQLIGSLGLGIASSCATSYFTSQALSLISPASTWLDKTVCPGAGYLVPGALALGSYGLQKLAENKDRLTHISTGGSSIWSYIGSWASSAKNLIIQNSVVSALNSYCSKFYQNTGIFMATKCNEHLPLAPQTCSTLADKTAHTALTAATIVATSCAEHLLPHDQPQLRVKKDSLMPPTTADASTNLPMSSAPETTKSPIIGSTVIQGPQIAYFLAKNGCDTEKLWNHFLSQSQQVKASGEGNWRQLCAKQLARLHINIKKTFATITKKLSPITSSIIDLIHNHMPFGSYPQQFELSAEHLNKEEPSFACTVDKESDAIFNGIQDAVLSYFDPENLQIRNQREDQAIFNCPQTPIFITVDKTSVTITAYPQSRQDLMYPHQWEKAVNLPRWFRIASTGIPYAIMAGNILLTKSSNYFLPHGNTCFDHDGTTYCLLTPDTCFNQDNSTTCCLPEGGTAIFQNGVRNIAPHNGSLVCTSTSPVPYQQPCTNQITLLSLSNT